MGDERMSSLVVDDDPLVRELMSEVLKFRGHDVRVAGDGVEGLAAFREEPCDLILLDIGMPRMDGLEMLRHVRALDSHVGVILMSGHASERERVEGQNLGAVLIYKPTSIASLNTLLDLLEEERRRWKSGGISTEPLSGVRLIGSANDRRRQVRAKVDWPAFVQPLNGTNGERPCRIVDISLGGTGIQSQIDHPLDPGRQVAIRFTPPDEQEPICVNGTIMWARSTEGLCGVRFVNVDDATRTRIENFVVAALARRLR